MYKAEQADCAHMWQHHGFPKMCGRQRCACSSMTLGVVHQERFTFFFINKKATSNLFGSLISLCTDLMQFWCPLCWFYIHSAQLVNQNCLCAAPEPYNRGGGPCSHDRWATSLHACVLTLKHLPAGRLSLRVLSGGGLSSPRVGANFRGGVLGIFLWRQKKKRISARVTTQLRNKWVAREEVEENIRGGGLHAAFVDLAANSTPPNLFPSLFLPLCKVKYIFRCTNNKPSLMRASVKSQNLREMWWKRQKNKEVLQSRLHPGQHPSC